MPTPAEQEQLDIVNAADQVVGVAARGDIHRLGLMHRSVHMLVFNSRAELFIQKRSMNKDNNPGLWDSSAAGHLNRGESYFDCANRELFEELAITLTTPLAYLFHLPPDHNTGMEHCHVYRGVHDGPFQLQLQEIDEGQWLSGSDMDRRVSHKDPTLTPILQVIWKQYRQIFSN